MSEYLQLNLYSVECALSNCFQYLQEGDVDSARKCLDWINSEIESEINAILGQKPERSDEHDIS